MLSAALRYAAMGWPVLPLHWIENGECSCRRFGFCRPGIGKHEHCSNEACEVCKPGKHPFGRFAPEAWKDATVDSEQIRSWWGHFRDLNIGISCDRFIVVDIDPRNGGAEWMAEQVRLNGRLPVTPTARTGSGGWHYLFKPPSFETLGRVGPGVDLKKRGGYIVAPPSRTTLMYAWLRPPETPLAELPAWLQSLAKRPEPAQAIQVADIGEVALDRRIARAMAYLEHVEPAVQGQNGSTRTLTAAAHVARGFALPPDRALAAMRDWNARCQPPWSDRELKRKIDEALRKYVSIQPGQHLR